MGRLAARFATLAAALNLAACSGGAVDSVTLPDSGIGQLRAESSILRLERIVDRSDTLHVSGIHLRYAVDTEGEEPPTIGGMRLPNLQGETLRAYLGTACADGRCVVDDTLVTIETEWDPRTVINAQDLIDPSVDVDARQVAVGSAGGFDNARTAGVFEIGERIPDPCGNGPCRVSAAVVPAATGYGLWGNYGYAAVEVAGGFWSGEVDLNLFGRAVGQIPFEGEVSYAWAYATGNATGTNPTSGRARWQGIAEAASTHRLERRRGTVLVTVSDLSNPLVSVEIYVEGRAIGSERWVDMPLAEGHFVTGTAGSDYLEGSFHGPEHSEAYGVFDTAAYIGAFGARRD